MALSGQAVMDSGRFFCLNSNQAAPAITVVRINPVRADHAIITAHQFCLHDGIPTTTTTTKPFVISIWGRLDESKENCAGSDT